MVGLKMVSLVEDGWLLSCMLDCGEFNWLVLHKRGGKTVSNENRRWPLAGICLLLEGRRGCVRAAVIEK